MEEYDSNKDWSTLHHRPGVQRAVRKACGVGVMVAGIAFASVQGMLAYSDESLAQHAAEQHQAIEAAAMRRLVLDEALLGSIALGASVAAGLRIMRDY